MIGAHGRAFGKWFLTWLPFFIVMGGLWNHLDSRIGTLQTNQAVILERIGFLSSGLETLQANDERQDAWIADLRVQIFRHVHDNGVKDHGG